MPLTDNFTAQEVNDAIADLKVCIDDAKRDGIFRNLAETYLPRLAHLLTQNKVLVQMLNELPQSDIIHIISESNLDDLPLDKLKTFPVEPKARLSKQIAILVAVGKSSPVDMWGFAEKFFGYNNVGRFWEEIFFPATRDLMRYTVSLQKDLIERHKSNKSEQKPKMSAPKSYSLDLFVSHSNKDKRLANSLIEFLRAALAIPAERVRCTSVDGYKLSGGAKTEVQLPKDIQGARCFIGLITPASLKSQFVLFELGARWGSGEHLVPVLGGGFAASALRPPLSNLNALNSASESDMEQLVHELAKELKKTVPLPTIYKTQLSALIETTSLKPQVRGPKQNQNRPEKPKRKTKDEKNKEIVEKIARRNFPERFEPFQPDDQTRKRFTAMVDYIKSQKPVNSGNRAQDYYKSCQPVQTIGALIKFSNEIKTEDELKWLCDTFAQPEYVHPLKNFKRVLENEFQWLPVLQEARHKPQEIKTEVQFLDFLASSWSGKEKWKAAMRK